MTDIPSRSRRRLWWLVGAVVAVVGLGLAGWTFRAPEPGSPGTGLSGQAPPIELARLDAPGTVSLGELRGRPVVVNFFASWCVPCRNELPAFREVAGQLGDRVAFLGINHRDERKAAQALLAEFRIPYPAGYDPEGKVAVAFSLLGMPSTVFVSAEGQLLERHTGELSRAQLEAAVERLFGIRVG